jgi:hypothetical glycosyl hydrolase
MAEGTSICFDSGVQPSRIAVEVRDVLTEIRKSGVKTAIYLDSSQIELGIRELFDAVIDRDDSSDGIGSACNALGLQPKSCVAVSNTVEAIRAASNKGMRTIGIGDKTILYAADYVIPSIKYISSNLVKSLY